MKKDFVIGVVGGMGTYATIHLFQQYARIFPAEKEWDRPRIVIDNRCTMPSRVRAFLYNEKTDQLVNEMTESMQELLNMGCTKIVLACNTSHLFLPRIYEKAPALQKHVVHIISTCVNQIASDGIEEIYLLGSEGTIDSKIYQNAFAEKHISCIVPQPEEHSMLRDCIEAVKQNKYTDRVRTTFIELVNRYPSCVLGCTELPILYEKYKEAVTCERIYDPLLLGIMWLKKEYDNE